MLSSLFHPCNIARQGNLFLSSMDALVVLISLWVSVLLGLAIGWIWKPKWVILSCLQFMSTLSRAIYGHSAGALTASMTPLRILNESWKKFRSCPYREDAVQQVERNETKEGFAGNAVGEDDLRDLYCRFYYKDGGVPWELMMERSIPGHMTYQAWRRDPEGGGPTEYRSRTVFEDASIDLLKDFYWDDEFRHQWDDMIIYTKSLEVCTKTGAEISHWIRKFPFFCSDREYIFGRRIYEVGGIFFNITKGVPYPAVPPRKRPRRVDVYSSCWCIQTAQSPQTGQMTACEVTFLHSEDMGIQRDIAKLGVRQGMWNCVKNMERGFRKYQAFRKSTTILSFHASLAKLVAHVPITFFNDFDEAIGIQPDPKHQQCAKAWKWLVVGAAVVLACRLDKRIVGKAITLGLPPRLMKLGRQL